MFSEIAKSALDLLKLAPRYMFAIAAVTGVLLFVPEELLARVSLEDFAKANRQWLGLAFLISSILWGIATVGTAWHWIQGKLTQRSIRRHITEKLESLTEDEKQILRYYFAKGTRANMLKVDDGIVQGLVANHIIYRSASMGNLIEGFAHNITDFAWKYVHANPHVLQGSTNVYRTDKRDWGW